MATLASPPDPDGQHLHLHTEGLPLATTCKKTYQSPEGQLQAKTYSAAQKSIHNEGGHTVTQPNKLGDIRSGKAHAMLCD